MPIIYMDVALFVTTLVAAAGIGGATAWYVRHRRALVPVTPIAEPTDDLRPLLRLMSRADHTLESYVTAIQGNLSVLGDDLPTDTQRWAVSRDAIAHASDQMKRHLQRLRLIRIGLDESGWRVSPVNLPRLLEGILIGLEPAATERGVKLRMEVRGTPKAVPADPEMVDEILTTLIDNAIRHNPTGTEIVAELASVNGDATVTVSDNGKGIADTEALFAEGVRNRSAGASRGTGMGLYVAKLLTDLQGGTIEATSEPGKGSSFTLALPLTRASA